jgi:hypothetical protein
MKNNFNTPITIKILSYTFICLTPVLLYVIIFITKIEISQKIVPINMPTNSTIVAPFSKKYSHIFSINDLTITLDKKQLQIDSFYFFSDSIYICLHNEVPLQKLTHFDNFILYLQQKNTLYNIINTKN